MSSSQAPRLDPHQWDIVANDARPRTGPRAGLIGILPTAARPSKAVYAIVDTWDGTYADLGIAPNGQIGLIGPRPPAVEDLSLLSLEGITYKLTSFRTKAIAINGLNWSGHAGFGSRGPSWYIDRSGIVHLQGAVKAISNGGPFAGLIGTLPRAARPSMFIYTITHTFGGTYSDLEITPDGRILRLGAHVPAADDNSFLSLESITYKR